MLLEYTLDYIFRFFLLFSTDLIIIPIVIFGYIWLSRKTFYHAICIMLFAALFNVALKVTFKIPLAPMLNKEGYAFPSGHMQYAFVLYVWIAMHLKNWRRILWPTVLVMLTGIGFGLMHFGYHTYFDVLAAVFFGSLFITFYKALWRSCNEGLLRTVAFILSSIFMIYIHFAFKIEAHVWKSYYALIGILVAEHAFGSTFAAGKSQENRHRYEQIRLQDQTIKAKTLATLMCAFVVLCVIKIADFGLVKFPTHILQARWMLACFAIPFSCYIVGCKKA